jgi:hypothetical protein
MNKKKIFSLRNLAKAVLTFVLPVFSVLFLVGTTTVIIIIMKGYSIDITKRELIKTGVLNIETNPPDVEIKIDSNYSGKTNKAISNLKIGNYQVELHKDGYFDYKKSVTIEHGLATPLIVPLIRTKQSSVIVEKASIFLTDHNAFGYYVLSPVIQNQTQTPTVKTTKAKEPTNTHLLTHVTTVKPLFDDPQPSTDETMTLQTLTATPITAIAMSPTGKQCLVTTTDKAGALSIALIPFRKGSTVNINLSNNVVLTNYLQDKTTTIKWSISGDFIIIETAKQIISYNVKTGARVILLEKTEIQSKNTVVWRMGKNGIVTLRLIQGSQSPNYEIAETTYSGNPLSISFPTILFEDQPRAIWNLSTQNQTVFAISTAKGSYLVGKLYAQKTGDLDISLLSEKVGDLTIQQIKDDYSIIKFSNETITEEPHLLALKYGIAFLENGNKNVVLFTFNKRVADTQSVLGRTTVIKEENVIDSLSSFATDSYLLYVTNKTVKVADNWGLNFYTLQENVVTYEYSQNSTALLTYNADSSVQFRVLR